MALHASSRRFVYRDSRFNHDEHGAIPTVTFGLRRSGRSESIRYDKLSRALGANVGGPLAAR